MKHFNKLYYVALILASHNIAICMDEETILRLSGPSGSANYAWHGKIEQEKPANMDTEQLTTFLRDKITNTKKTLSPTTAFSEDEYHKLLWHCRDILNTYAQKNSDLLTPYAGGGIMILAPYGPNVAKQAVTEFLQAMETPTSIKLLTNLETTNFIF